MMSFNFESLSNLLDKHEYLAYLILFVWTFIEGETIVIIAGFAAIDNHPNPYLVMLSAFAGSLAGDQTWFFVGRYKGNAFLAKRPAWRQRADRVLTILHRHHTLLILGFRFLYGLRNVTPFALGTSEVKTSRFIILNVIGAAVWAVTFTMLGYFFGKAAEDWIAHYKIHVVVALCAIVAIFWVLRVYVRRRRGRAAASAQAARSPLQK